MSTGAIGRHGKVGRGAEGQRGPAGTWGNGVVCAGGLIEEIVG